MSYQPQYPDEYQLVEDVYAVFNTHRALLLKYFPPEEDMFGMSLAQVESLNQTTDKQHNVDAANLIRFFVAGHDHLSPSEQIMLKPVVEGLRTAIKGELARKPDALNQPVSITNMMSLLGTDEQIKSLLTTELKKAR
jgi:hypothetical protein